MDNVISKIKINDDTYNLYDSRVDDTTYKLPSDGIPKSDLNSSVAESLDKADSSMQYTDELIANTTEIENYIN